MKRFGRVWAVALAEARLIWRDRASLSLLLTVPVLQVILFGLAIDLDPRNLTVHVSGPAEQVTTARELLAQTGYFAEPVQVGDPEASVRGGSAQVGIRIPAAVDPFDAPADARPQPVEIFVDATVPAAVTPALAQLAIDAWARSLRRSDGAGGVTIAWLHNPDRRTSWTIVPGLIGTVIMISMLMVGALSIVRDRESGALEGLRATAITPVDIILGKALPYLMAAAVQALSLVIVAVAGFDIPLAGPGAFLLLAVPLFAYAHLVLGLVISMAARSQMQALQAAVAFYLPALLLSGFMFPFNGMAAWAQALGELFPLTHMVRALRGLMLQRAGWPDLAVHLLPMTGFALALTGLGLVIGRRRL